MLVGTPYSLEVEGAFSGPKGPLFFAYGRILPKLIEEPIRAFNVVGLDFEYPIIRDIVRLEVCRVGQEC